MWVKRLSQSALIRGSATVFIGNNIISFGNFLYNLAMGRMLGPEKYGDLGALFSILILLSTPLSILGLLIVKQTSAYWGQKNIAKIYSLKNFLVPKLLVFGSLVTLIILLGNKFLENLLQIDNTPALVVIAFYFLLSGPAATNRAILQGTLHFTLLTLNSAVEVFMKIIVSVILVFLNFQLIGALLGPLIGGIISYLLGVYELKLILRVKDVEVKKRPSIKKLSKFAPIFFASLSLTIFFTIDIILVRHFFPGSVAGQYTALSTIGKIVFYAMGPVLTVMFPLISSRASSGQPYILSLFATMSISLGLSVVIITAYFLSPKLIVTVLFGEKYYGVIPYLGAFSFYMSIYSLNSILTHFLLSISYYKPVLPLFFVTLLQSIGIILIHNNIHQIIWVNTGTSFLYFIICILFVWQREKKEIIKLIMPPRHLGGGRRKTNDQNTPT